VAAGDLERQIAVRSRDEVGELVAAFNRMTTQLRESQDRLAAAERVAAWQAIAQRIAHEIKNPLSPIQTSIETLRKVHAKRHPSFEEVFEEATVTILDEVARLKRIVTEFSDFARLPKPRLAPCDLVELTRAIVGLHATEQVPVTLVVDQGVRDVLADREQLAQVLVNLIKNACEALTGAPAPRVSVTLRAAAEHVELQVADNGPGIAAAALPRIFTPYFTTKAASGGTGLGLAIAHRIVTEHGGAIEARNVDSGGAIFSVRLPAPASP
jgi:nitrogen fixation/metabolism regulation signal transduction histidine kinase